MMIYTEIEREGLLYELSLNVNYKAPQKSRSYSGVENHPHSYYQGLLDIKSLRIDGCYDDEGSPVYSHLDSSDISLDNDEIDDLFEKIHPSCSVF